MPKMTEGRAALLGLMNRYIVALMDLTISPLEVDKLMYLLQAAGEPLRLRYVKTPFGPHAENLNHLLRGIERNFIFDDAASNKAVILAPRAVRDAEKVLQAHPATHERFERVARLVEGFETPFGLELLTTVHWVATREQARDDESILRATDAWGPGKRQFTLAQISLAIERLRSQGWLASEAE